MLPSHLGAKRIKVFLCIMTTAGHPDGQEINTFPTHTRENLIQSKFSLGRRR